MSYEIISAEISEITSINNYTFHANVMITFSVENSYSNILNLYSLNFTTDVYGENNV